MLEIKPDNGYDIGSSWEINPQNEKEEDEDLSIFKNNPLIELVGEYGSKKVKNYINEELYYVKIRKSLQSWKEFLHSENIKILTDKNEKQHYNKSSEVHKTNTLTVLNGSGRELDKKLSSNTKIELRLSSIQDTFIILVPHYLCLLQCFYLKKVIVIKIDKEKKVIKR